MTETNQEIDAICANCEFAVIIRESDVCVCKHNGVVAQIDTCKKFSLDLLKLSPLPRKLPDEETMFFDL